MKLRSKNHSLISTLVLTGFLVLFSPLFSQQGNRNGKIQETIHTISSHTLFDYVKELCSEKFGGRLTGTEGYNKSAEWVISLLKKWGFQPSGDNGTFLQKFNHPHTLVLESGEMVLHIPYKNKKQETFIDKHYEYETDYLPGSTSGSGTVKAEVVYVGYGITAPELGYDEYKGLDVRGKIVLLERESPVSPSAGAGVFNKWRPYSFHQYKVKNAHEHGAAGMLYIYHIANPNSMYVKDFVQMYIADTIVADIFNGTGRDHKEVVEKIGKTLKPQSFRTKKIVTISNKTEHHPGGIASNVIGKIEGIDPEMKKEVVMLGAHLDHLGYNHEMMPGANDNASGVAVLLGVAEAIYRSGLKPKRTIIFNFFGAEEQGVAGSEYYLKYPVVPNESIVGFLNLDGVGRGTKIAGYAGKNYPKLWWYVSDANQHYVHREVRPTEFRNLARPRLDAAHFMWAGVPTVSFSAYGAEPLPRAVYHKTTDSPDTITPEILEDLAKILFAATMELSGY
ncbi:MAG: M20/M25/M40 family metallo-hydrolase [bacterium]|nr:M20/M25/M40 family metallo-hydrolase [bacterium]